MIKPHIFRFFLKTDFVEDFTWSGRFRLDNSFGSQCGFNFSYIVFHFNDFIVPDRIDLSVYILDLDKKLIPRQGRPSRAGVGLKPVVLKRPKAHRVIEGESSPKTSAKTIVTLPKGRVAAIQALLYGLDKDQVAEALAQAKAGLSFE